MIEQFKQKFIEEANELIGDLEESLLTLEENPNNNECIEKVFRVMHTLKGNSSMFGFAKMEEFTHNLESIYDLVRNNALQISSKLLSTTLESVDHLKALLVDEKLTNDVNIKKHEKLSIQIKEIIEIKEEVLDTPQEEAVSSSSTYGNSTFLVSFKPNEDILKFGTNPLFLLEDLHSVGKAIVIANLKEVPELDEITPDVCYTDWTAIVSTSEGYNGIMDVFIFVEDECKLEINEIASFDLINDEFEFKIRDDYSNGIDISSSYLKNLADNITPQVLENIDTVADDESAEKSSSQYVAKENLISSIRVSSDKLDSLMNLVSELVISQARLLLLSENDNSNSELGAISENFEKITRQLRDITFSICLIPIETQITRFRRLIRDLSSELGKDILFTAEGTDTELDKTIIENLTDPLLHIIRNSIDHGIETPEARVKKGKPAQGKLLLKAFYSGANVHVQIIDDGAGIDVDKVKAKAIEKGLITPDKILTEKDAFDLIFLPGFSTAAKVTGVSGRGVGMDVVKRNILKIRGEIDIESKLNVGTTLTIKLPLTLSIIDGLLVKISDTYFVIPLSVVNKCYEVKKSELTNSYNNLIVLDEEQFPFYYLRDEFKMYEDAPEQMQMVVVEFDGVKVGLSFDTIVGKYQAVLKPLGKLFKNQDLISGATILGDGTIALIMDTNKIISKFSNEKIKREAQFN